MLNRALKINELIVEVKFELSLFDNEKSVLFDVANVFVVLNKLSVVKLVEDSVSIEFLFKRVWLVSVLIVKLFE